MIINETNLGYLLQTNSFTILFGGSKATLSSVEASFENVDFVRVKQTHGDHFVLSTSSTSPLVEADAHYTGIPNLGLCIATADCIPVFIYDSVTGFIAGIHAGWRGVANRIVPKAIDRLVALGGSAKHMRVFVGPHIQMNNFEVDYQVRDQVLLSIDQHAEEAQSLYHRNISPEKSLVDLNQVLKTQLQNSGISFDHLFILHIDTFSDSRFHSYRRDKELSGRQLSFIFRN